MSEDARAGEAGGEAESGLSGLELAQSCWRAMAAARVGTGFTPAPELADCDESVITRWRDGVRAVERAVLASGESGGSFSATAADLGRHMLSGDDPAPEFLIPMEAAVRHAANVMDYEPEDGRLADLESGWEAWARQRAEALAPPVAALTGV